MSSLEIRIEELVLRDLPPAYAEGLAGRLERELRRLAHDGDSPRLTGGRLDSVRPAPATTAARDADDLARQAAAAVWAAVTAAGPTGAEGAAR